MSDVSIIQSEEQTDNEMKWFQIVDREKSKLKFI
jgi:hypothetical protein